MLSPWAVEIELLAVPLFYLSTLLWKTVADWYHRTKEFVIPPAGSQCQAIATLPGAETLPPPVLRLIPDLLRRYGHRAVRAQLATMQCYGDAVEDPALWLELALRHNFRPMPIERVRQCPCGSRRSTLLHRFIFWNLLSLRRCHDCGLLFVSPRLTAAAMQEMFSCYYNETTGPDYWDRRRQPVFDDVLALLGQLGCRNVFDVGTAYGHFLDHLQRAGYRAAGCELSRENVEWGRTHLGVEIHHGSLGEVSLPSGSVDCVVSLDTFYYVADPLAELREIRRVLCPGGHVVLRLRNGLRAEWRARWTSPSGTSRGVIPAQHLWAFTPATIARLAQKVGLEPVAALPAAYSRSPLWPVQSLGMHFNRWACRRLGAPVLTSSFNFVARRPLDGKRETS